MPREILSVVGARPQFIKAAAVSRALRSAPDLTEVLVHTGQHFDENMSAVFFTELDITTPAYNLGVHGGGHGAMTGRMMAALEEVVVGSRPDAVLVYGDTNSTLAGALVAAKLHIPLAHVEAGLRSRNRKMPEEINRIVVDHLSDLLFCPTSHSVENLTSEGITRGVHKVGDIMLDATLHQRELALERSTILARLGLAPGAFALCTVHRAENTDDRDRLDRIMRFLEQEAESRPIVFPVHPRTRAELDRLAHRLRGITLIDPVGVLDMHRLLAGASVVYTDSGGLQKEAYFHRVPCVTLRDETEWIETITHGWNRLWTGPAYLPRREIDEYGDGNAGRRIVEEIGAFLG